MILIWLCAGEKEYYEKQFATLKSFEEVDAIVSSDGVDEEDLDEQIQQVRAMKISNYANVLLLAFKVISHRFVLIVKTDSMRIIAIQCIYSIIQCFLRQKTQIK